MRVSGSVLAFALILSGPSAASAAGTYVPAPQRADAAYEASRDVVYVTNGRSILRWSVSLGAFLSAWTLDASDATVSGSLLGADLSPDGNTLAVADAARSASQNWIWLVDLSTGTASRVRFSLAFQEAGTFSVAYGADGALFVTGSFDGDGFVPVRRYDPRTGATTTVPIPPFGTITQDAMLAATGDASGVGFVQTTSDGPFGRIRVADLDVISKGGYTDGTSAFNFEIGANADGSQYAIPTSSGTYVADGSLAKTNTGNPIGPDVNSQPVGVVYDPVRPLVYFAWKGSKEVRAYDASSLAQTSAIDVGSYFTDVASTAYRHGRLKLSRDGSLLMATVGDPAVPASAIGVQVVRLYAPLAAVSSTYPDAGAQPTAVTLGGSIGIPATLVYSIVQPPVHGSLSGTAPNLTYTPGPGYNTHDGFTYQVRYGRATATGTISIGVDQAPVASNGATTLDEDTSADVTLRATDADGDALTYSIVTPPAHGTLSGTVPNLVYTPAPNYNGSDQLTFQASDGQLASNAAAVTFTVRPVNDPPVARNDAAATKRNTAVTIAVLANDSDADGDALTIVSATAPKNGTAAIAGSGIRYTPKSGFTGTDSFSYTISDGHGGTASATVTVTVTKS
jgi:hypothetical protein